MHLRTVGKSLVGIVVLGGMLLTGCTSDDETAETTTTTTEVPTTTTAPPTTTTTPSAVLAGLAPEPVAGERYFAPFPVSVTLDGDLTDWAGIPRAVVPPTANVVLGSTSVEFAATADDEVLYLMGDVTDSRIITGEHGTDFWNEDSVEFYINGTGDPDLTSYTTGVAQITVPPLNAGRPPEEVVLGGVQADSAEATVVVVETADGYAVEMAIPLQNRVWNIQREQR